MSEKKKKERSANFSPTEIDLLVKLVSQHAKVIECKKTDAATWKDKENEWEQLALEYNSANSTCPRNVKSLKTKYECLKKDIKKKVALQKQSLYQTGGGASKDIIFTPTEEILISIITFSIQGLSSRSDCDQGIVNLKFPQRYNFNFVVINNENIKHSVVVSEPPDVELDIVEDIPIMDIDVILESVGLNYFYILISNNIKLQDTTLLPPMPSVASTSQNFVAVELPSTSTTEPTVETNWAKWNPSSLRKPVSKSLKVTPKKNKMWATRKEAMENITNLSASKGDLIKLQCESIILENDQKKILQEINLKKAKLELQSMRLDVKNKLIEKKIKLEQLMYFRNRNKKL
ncbi:uncharacterized protein LOC116169288 isoform X1 [Photinus pyralis]|uniref:uncharacterized protein LOC116159015 isoform X1 n=1 Tax=Photinus pyralis TaxID=7054 RepID=UPI0012677803|nr:uncharacterized protein LOC116159015 isoform X1 [Photinus pyralis]XP_031336548.1 uncharacterized protein LOC116165928 isoform X1 [Photinus pyralis]XP_031341200.1 uncharacterized protein LOC116169288 isoform X1 [Photinus pyralis]XP_031341201.1 uncharacterized protein LOC116169288 isoform X1 [Photinus pyralis]